MGTTGTEKGYELEIRSVEEKRNYICDDPELGYVQLRILQPSEPRGGWPGTTRTIRQWTAAKKGEGVHRNCTEDEVKALEHSLGEIENPTFTQHRTLGLVVIG